MKTKYIEVTNEKDGHHFNWGKFCVAQWEAQDYAVKSKIDNRPLVSSRGWTPDRYLWVMDLQTGEGACFKLGGMAEADLNKTRIWVCPMFSPFLTWLYEQKFVSIEELPEHVNLPDAPGALRGYRRPGGNVPEESPP